MMNAIERPTDAVEPVIDLELERQEILKRYRRLLRAAKPMLKGDDAKLIKKASDNSAHKSHG